MSYNQAFFPKLKKFVGQNIIATYSAPDDPDNGEYYICSGMLKEVLEPDDSDFPILVINVEEEAIHIGLGGYHKNDDQEHKVFCEYELSKLYKMTKKGFGSMVYDALLMLTV